MGKFRFSNFCFTLNNYTKDQEQELENGSYKYIIYGYEISESGTPHLQGYCELQSKRTITGIKKLLNIKELHIEKRKGTQQQAIVYCQKDNKYVEFGDKNNAGQRTDILKIRDDVKNGKKLIDIVDEMENPNFQTIRCAQLLKTIYSRPRSGKPVVIWIYGATGIGKTRLVYDTFTDIYTKDSTKWYNNYEQNKVLLIDDYRKDFCKFKDLLTLLDRYPKQVETKGGYIHINSKFIILTSPYSPLRYWQYKDGKEQLFRRIDKIINMALHNQIKGI